MSGLTILALVFVLYALLAGRLDRLSITAPMVFVVVGGILGPGGTGLLRVSFSNETALATILAPTDAALGLAVVTNTAVPGRIRRALNVESGLNDGLVTPFVTLFLAIVVSEESSANEGWVAAALTQIGLAVVAAVVVGLGGGWLVSRARSHAWTSPVSEQLAVLAYTGSVAIGGNGFVAAFVGGLLFGQATKGSLYGPVEFSETIGLFMSFFVWTLFGALFVGPVLTRQTHWTAIGYAVLSLTVVRMLPVALSLIGLGMHRSTLLFMGWFGPRGLASVVFTLVALEDLKSGSPDQNPLVQVATWTILLSVVAHGVTAGIWAPRYGARMISRGDVPELAPAHQPRMRKRALTRHPSHGDAVDQADTVDQGGEKG